MTLTLLLPTWNARRNPRRFPLLLYLRARKLFTKGHVGKLFARHGFVRRSRSRVGQLHKTLALKAAYPVHGKHGRPKLHPGIERLQSLRRALQVNKRQAFRVLQEPRMLQALERREAAIGVRHQQFFHHIPRVAGNAFPTLLVKLILAHDDFLKELLLRSSHEWQVS